MLSIIYNYAIDKGYTDHNPAEKVKKTKKKQETIMLMMKYFIVLIIMLNRS